MKKNKTIPPKAFHRFFQWFCHPDLQKYIEGDLFELYEERRKVSGKRKADINFAVDVLMLFRPSIIRPVQEYHTLNHSGMFKNYFKVGMRNILKYKVFSFINVFGLALAMSVCMLIILMLADQKRYDQFHDKKERIFRILSDRDNSKVPSATTPFPLAGALQSGYPAIEETTQLTRGVGGDVAWNQRTAEVRGYFADPAFFKIFAFELVKGDPITALVSPNSMVITSEHASKLFREENPVGKTVQFSNRGLSNLGSESGDLPVDWGTFTITGVISDKNYKSHLKFDVLVSSSSMTVLQKQGKIEDQRYQWSTNQSYTYVMLTTGKTAADLTASVNDLINRKQPELKDVEGFRLIPQNLTDITPGILVGNEPSRTLPLIVYYFLSFLAMIIMISACLNYTNLATARSLTRAKEIGVRKVTGAKRKDLVYQFLSESIITSILALGMASILMIFLKSGFMALWINRYLLFELQGNIQVYLIFLAFALLIGLVAGIYPAVRLSAYQPIKALKNTGGSMLGKLGMQKILGVSQFVISLFFITTSILIFNQFRHFLRFEYGFNPENIVNVALQGNDFRKLKNEFSKVPGVSEISACNYIPSTGTNNGISLRPLGSEQEYEKLTYLIADENFINNLDVKLLSGRHLEETDSTNRFIVVNEAAVKAFGFEYPAAIIGHVFESEWGKESLEVIGVVEDFFVKQPMGEDHVSPLALRNRPHDFSYANIKIASPDLMGTVARLEREWKKIDVVHTFRYEFYDDQLANMHQGLFDVVSILGFIAFIAITIACLGLLGMSTYTSERKKKEVGIRKVLGAAELSIALLLSKGFLKMLIISVCIGAPMTYFLNNLWLQRFPNRVDFGFGTLLLGTTVLLVLGLITIGSQTIRASKQNPVESLKMD